MKVKLSLLLLVAVTCSFISSPTQLPGSEIQDLVVLKSVITDKDLQSYLKCKRPSAYPVMLKYADKAYMLSDPKSALKEIPLTALSEDSSFVVKSFKILDEGKVRIKIDYLDKKLLFTAEKFSPSYWTVRSFFARKAGGIKPEMYTFK